MRKSSRFRRFLLLLPIIILAGCGYQKPQPQLRAIDGIIESRPDSAMALLGAIDRAGFSAADSAYYALLYTQAQIKTNVYLTSDSLISRALDAYRFSSDPDLRKRAHFYAAKVAYYQRNYHDAMKNAVVAYDISKECNDPYWIAKSAETLGDIYTEAYNYAQAGRYTKIAVAEYLKAGKERNHRFALCDLATNYNNRSLYDSAYMVVDSVISVARSETPVDSALLHYAQRVLIGIHWVSGDYTAMAEAMNGYEYNSPEQEGNLIYSIIESYAATSQGDSAAYSKFMSRAYGLADDEKELLPVVYAEYCNAVSNGNFEKVVKLSDSIIHLQCRVADVLLDESVTAIQSDYYASQNVLKKQKNESLQLLLTVSVISAVVAIILLVIIYSLKLKAARADIKANIASMQLLKAKSSDNAQLVESLLKDKWAIVNRLCNVYYEKSESEGMMKHVVQEIESELNSLRTPENLNEIIAATDKYSDGAITMLRTECVFLKKQDIDFIALIFAGLSVRAVCYITGIKKDYFYKKKNRLLRRIAASDASHKEIFVALLSQFVA